VIRRLKKQKKIEINLNILAEMVRGKTQLPLGPGLFRVRGGRKKKNSGKTPIAKSPKGISKRGTQGMEESSGEKGKKKQGG